MGVTQGVKRSLQQNRLGRATIFGERTRSWAEFVERVARLAGGLRGLGVGSGDRVAILSLNSDRYLEFYVAVPWAGGVVVPLNIRWSAAENVYSLNDSGASVLLIDDAFLKLAPAILAEAKEGHPGWTIAQVKSGIDTNRWLESYRPDSLLHIGTNDIRQGRAATARGDLAATRWHPRARARCADHRGSNIIPFRRGSDLAHRAYNAAIPGIVASIGPLVSTVDRNPHERGLRRRHSSQ